MTITSQNLELQMYVPSPEPNHWIADYRFVIATVILRNHSTLHIRDICQSRDCFVYRA